MTISIRPITPAQTKLFVHQRLFPKDAAYNIAGIFRIQGNIDVARLQRACTRVAQDILVWNMTFEDGEHGPVARLRDVDSPDVRALEVPVLPIPGGNEATLLEEASRLADTPLPPEVWPLGQAAIYRGDGVVYLMLICSHLVVDAYTFYNTVAEFVRLYFDPDAPRNPATLFLDSTTGRESDPEAMAYFQRELRDVAFIPEGLACERNADGILTGRRERLACDVPLASRLSAAMNRAEVQRAAFFLGIHAVMLGALTGSQKHVIGFPLPNRVGPARKKAFGYFVNVLPIAVDLDAHATFRDLCQHLQLKIRTLARYQSFDFTRHAPQVIGSTQKLANVGFGTSFTYYKHSIAFELEDFRVDLLPLERRHVVFPFTFNVEEDAERFAFYLEYADRFAERCPSALLSHLLSEIVNDVDAPLNQLRALGPEEEERIDALVNVKQRFATEQSIAARFESVVDRYPHKIAVFGETGSCTYAELDAKANRIARVLAREVPERYVGVALPATADLIAVLLGALKAGKAYVPIDPKSPPDRARSIITRFDRLPVVADRRALTHVTDLARLDLHALLASASRESDARLPVTDQRSDTAYVIFTSGSTGEPKGVEVSHENLLRLFAATDQLFELDCNDTWSLFFSTTFDFSVWEMYGALFHGARLAIVPERIRRAPTEVLEFICSAGVTVLSQTPSWFRQLVQVMSAEHLERLGLRYVVFGGEALQYAALRRWYELAGDRTRLVNMYGITETTVHTTFHAVTAAQAQSETASVIGKPLGDLGVHIVDSHLRPCPIGVAGEILVSGPGVAKGYLNAPELTQKKFLSDRELGEVVYRSGDLGYVRSDGTIVYLGRSDRQVKLRGFRIELGEIEAALSASPGVADCVVRLDKSASEPCLVAYIVVPNATASSDQEIRTALKDKIPSYMVPAHFIRADKLPLTVNGKIDDAALERLRAEASAPRSARGPAADGLASRTEHFQAGVAAIWRDLLQTDKFDFDDNFFEVGGSSVHVVALHQRLSDNLGARDLKLIDLFEYTTVNALAKHLCNMERPS